MSMNVNEKERGKRGITGIKSERGNKQTLQYCCTNARKKIYARII